MPHLGPKSGYKAKTAAKIKASGKTPTSKQKSFFGIGGKKKSKTG